eukprot:scaffold206303_cov36-Cyclotella_meneghiniana.AAC.2
MDILVSKVVIKNRQDCCKSRLSNTTVSLLDTDDNVVGTYRIEDASNSVTSVEIEMKDFNMISAGLKVTAYNEALSSQQFRITKNDQLESIVCPGQVLSVAVQATSWMCKKSNTDIGLVTVDGNHKPANSKCNTKSSCNNDCTIDPTPTNNDYCVDGNKLLLKNSSPGDISQKWRFYPNGIMNLACKRKPLFQGLVISQVNDNDFRDLSLFEDLELSFVNDGMAISIVSLSLKFCA